MIEIAELWKAFGSVRVLKGVSLRVERGSVVAIIGPSGSGKSTLLRCVNLLEEPDRGRIRVGEREMRFGEGHRRRPVDRELSAFRAATGMVFQHFNLFPHMTALGNVMAGPAIVKRLPRPEAKDIARALLEKVGLGDKADAYPSHLSGGQRQRVAIARALAMNPAVMLCDEVTSALDLVAFMSDGVIVESGPPSQLLENPQNPRTRGFLARFHRFMGSFSPSG
jgi:polar amino acid transport system ATP-binding protein